MYQGFAQHHGWSFDTLEYMTSDLGQWHKSTDNSSVACSSSVIAVVCSFVAVF